MKFFQLNGNLFVVFRPVVVLLADEHARDHDLRKKGNFGKYSTTKATDSYPAYSALFLFTQIQYCLTKGKSKFLFSLSFLFMPFLLSRFFCSFASSFFRNPSFNLSHTEINVLPLEEGGHTSLSSVCWVDLLEIFS